MPTKRCRYHKPSDSRRGVQSTDAAHNAKRLLHGLRKKQLAAVRRGGCLLCESCEGKYGLSIRADEQKTIRDRYYEES
jgi:hypothetical protein